MYVRFSERKKYPTVDIKVSILSFSSSSLFQTIVVKTPVVAHITERQWTSSDSDSSLTFETLVNVGSDVMTEKKGIDDCCDKKKQMLIIKQ